MPKVARALGGAFASAFCSQIMLTGIAGMPEAEPAVVHWSLAGGTVGPIFRVTLAQPVCFSMGGLSVQ